MLPTTENNVKYSSPKRCCILTAALLLMILLFTSAILVALGLTIFRPRDPTFDVYLVGLPRIRLEDILGPKNITRNVFVSIRNENYASFAWRNFTASIGFNGETVGEAPIQGDTIFQRSRKRIIVPVTLHLDRLLASQNWGVVAPVAFGYGVLNFTSSVRVSGDIKPFNVIFPRVRGSISIDCLATAYVSIHSNSDDFFAGRFGGHAWCWAVKKELFTTTN